MSTMMRAILRGFALISFTTSTRNPRKSKPFSCEYMPIIVLIHAAVAEHIKSVGEKDSPFP